jgi:hypothetical protein
MHHQASVLERIIEPQEGTLPANVAEYFLSLDFPKRDHSRYEELSAKAQEGTLTEAEKVDLDDLLTANDVLMILQSKARLSLKHRNPAA